MHNDVLFYLALQAIEGIGPLNARKLLSSFGGPKELFNANLNELRQVKGIGPKLAENIKSPKVWSKAENELSRAIKAKIKILTWSDERYPKMLKQCPDAPIVLFSKGSLEFNNRQIISIVGTRKMTSYSEVFLSKFMKELIPYDPVVISGLAYGVDICAHRLAVQNGLSTIGVLAHGLDRIYPRAHYQTAVQMIKRGGLITEFWTGASPEKENFVKRNRIIAGLSQATLVVESSGKGGSLITADLASSYYREVFAVPGRVNDSASFGCNRLIKSNKALMLTEARDLEYALNWKPLPLKDKSEKEMVFSNELEEILYNQLKKGGIRHVDELANESNTPVSKIFTALLHLELSGRVKSLSGNCYQLLD